MQNSENDKEDKKDKEHVLLIEILIEGNSEKDSFLSIHHFIEQDNDTTQNCKMSVWCKNCYFIGKVLYCLHSGIK